MHQVVVVGGGIAGLTAATHLARRLRNAGRVLLIDRNPAHVWKPMLHRFATGMAIYADENIPFASHASRNGFRYWPGGLDGLDRASRQVHLAPLALPDGQTSLPARSVPYETLVLALGSQADDFGTPGVAEHCHAINDIADAERFEDFLRSRIVAAADGGGEVSVAIVGGGATGVELAAALRQHMDALSGYAAASRRVRLRVTLVESGDRLLAPFPPDVSAAVQATLQRLGIAVMTGTQVVSADERGLATKGGGRIDAGLMVWAAGVKAPAVVGRLDGLQTNRRGQVVVRPTLQSATDGSVFALGDCGAFPTADGRGLPTTAQVAQQQASFLARALSRQVRHGRALPAFRFRDRGSLVSLGDYAAYGTLGSFGLFKGGFIEGHAAQLAHALLYRGHQLDMKGVLPGAAGWLADDLMRATRPAVRLS